MNPKADPAVEAFYHTQTGSFAYLVFDPTTRQAVIIDPVLDFDRRSGQLSTVAADAILQRIAALGLGVPWVLETHAHADHLSAAAYIKERLGCSVATGAGITTVQASTKRMFNLDAGFATDGSQFDRLWSDGEQFALGAIECTALATPGHTPDSVSYLIGNYVFVGDALFLVDTGTARCDFPGGSARQMFESVHKLYCLPESTRVVVGHDYPPPTREATCACGLREEKESNVHLNTAVSAERFVAFREARDATLPLPELFFFALQVNTCAGRLPPADANGARYFRVPAHAPVHWPQ